MRRSAPEPEPEPEVPAVRSMMFLWVLVFRGAGSPQKGNPPPPGSLSGLTSSVPSFNSATEPGPAGLPGGPEHLPAGAGRRPPTGRSSEKVRGPPPPHAHCHVSCKTLVLMSDLATVLDLQGHHDEALTLIQQAVDLSRSVGHPDQHVLLGNLAGILLHAGEFRRQVRPVVLTSSQPLLLSHRTP